MYKIIIILILLVILFYMVRRAARVWIEPKSEQAAPGKLQGDRANRWARFLFAKRRTGGGFGRSRRIRRGYWSNA